jgi:hypothetical protein
MNDPINPNHYKQGGIESIDAVKAFMSEEAFKGFLRATARNICFAMRRRMALRTCVNANGI